MEKPDTIIEAEHSQALPLDEMLDLTDMLETIAPDMKRVKMKDWARNEDGSVVLDYTLPEGADAFVFMYQMTGALEKFVEANTLETPPRRHARERVAEQADIVFDFFDPSHVRVVLQPPLEYMLRLNAPKREPWFEL